MNIKIQTNLPLGFIEVIESMNENIKVNENLVLGQGLM